MSCARGGGARGWVEGQPSMCGARHHSAACAAAEQSVRESTVAAKRLLALETM